MCPTYILPVVYHRMYSAHDLMKTVKFHEFSVKIKLSNTKFHLDFGWNPFYITKERFQFKLKSRIKSKFTNGYWIFDPPYPIQFLFIRSDGPGLVHENNQSKLLNSFACLCGNEQWSQTFTVGSWQLAAQRFNLFLEFRISNQSVMHIE